MKKLLTPEQKKELKKIRKAFKSLEESVSTWFYPVLFKIEDYEEEVVRRFIAQYSKNGFEFSETSRPSLNYPKRSFLLPGKDYYRHRNDRVRYLEVVKTAEIGVYRDPFGE